MTGTTIPATTLLKATITNGGTGYTTAPTVTLNSACPNTVTATATVASGVVTGITFGGTGTCTAAPTVTIAAPPASTATTPTCTAAPTVTIAAPTGTVTGTTAVLELAKNASNVVTGVTVTTQGSGYGAVPKVTVNGACTPYTPSVKATLTSGKVTSASLQVLTPTVEVAR